MDRINSVSAKTVPMLAFNVISANQDAPPASQIVALAVAFQAVCDALGLSPVQLLEKAGRLITDAERLRYDASIPAIKQYAQAEMKGRL